MHLSSKEIISFLHLLNKQLILKYSELKNEFERISPSNNEIKKTFMEWKKQLDALINGTLSQYTSVEDINLKEFVKWMTEQFANDQQFLEILKNVNSSIEMMKDFMRVHLMKDPTLYDQQ